MTAPRSRIALIVALGASAVLACRAHAVAVERGETARRCSTEPTVPMPLASRRSDPPPSHPVLAAVIVGGLYGSLYTYTYLAWYRLGSGTSSLQFRNEGWFGADTYAGGADKLGHLWANYTLTRGVGGVLTWGGMSKPAALLTSTGLALGFFTLIEIKDGLEPDYGFSWGDVVFNVGGIALGVAAEALPPAFDAAVDFRLEYWPSSYFLDEISDKGPFNTAEDYTGQRFLLAFHLAAIEPLARSGLRWLSWLDVTVGYRALHYRPDASDPNDPRQELYLGLSFDLQKLIAVTLMPKAGDAGIGARTLHFTAEVLGVPFTTLELGAVSRRGRPAPEPD
jgi:hypothetical protein